MGGLDAKVGGSLWRLIIGGVSAFAILVGAIAWANSVDNNAKQALRLGEENKARVEALAQQMNTQSNSLTELRVDMKYLISAVNELLISAQT